MSSSAGRLLSRQLKPFNKIEWEGPSMILREGPSISLVRAALAYLSRTEGIVRWKSDVSAFNRTKTHRTVALKFVDKFGQSDE